MSINQQDYKPLRRYLEVFIDTVGEILAYLSIFLILFMYINGAFGFLPEGIASTLSLVREVAIITVVSLKGLEFTLKRGYIATIIFAVAVVLIVVFMFFPANLPAFLQ